MPAKENQVRLRLPGDILWKKAAILVQERPDWFFIKLHSHSMDPTQREAVMGGAMQRFLTEFVEGALDRRGVIHFVTARQMVIWAACEVARGTHGSTVTTA